MLRYWNLLSILFLFGTGVRAQSSPCLFTAPYSENFDGSSWVSGSGSQASLGYLMNFGNQIDSCWTRPSGWNQFGARAGVTGSAPSTGPTSDVSGTGNYLLCEASWLADTGEISSPNIYMPNTLANPHLKFHYHLNGVHIDSLMVMVDTGSGFHSIFNLVGEQQFSHYREWLVATVDLSAYLGDTLQFRFKGYYMGWIADISIDEFSVESLSCGQSKGLNISSIYQDSLELSWDRGFANNWQVEYGPAGFIPGNGTVLAANANSKTLAGLSTSVTYDFYVRDSCGLGVLGYWSTPVRGGVLCDTVLRAPWKEDFDGSYWQPGIGSANSGNIIDQCWIRPGVYIGHFGTHSGSTYNGGTGPNADVSGSGNYIFSDGDYFQAVTGQIKTPLIYIPDTMVNPYLKFNYHMYGADIQNFRIRIDSGTGFLPASFILLNQQQSSSGSAWKADSIPLNDFLGDTIQFWFIGQSDGNRGDIALDEVEVLPDSSSFCPKADSISITNIGSTSATLDWVSGAAASDVEIVVSGQPRSSGRLITRVTPPLTVSNLIPDTNYVVYITDSCVAVSRSREDTGSFRTASCPPLSVRFSYTSTLLNVTFNSSASNNADSLHWDFGDGNTSTQSNPNHIYSNAGSYIVKLEAYTVCDTMRTAIDTIQVCDTLIANFSLTRFGDSVFVNSTGSGGATDYWWDFNGIKDSSGASTSHQFASQGLKTIRLIVRNACGDTDTISKQVQVCALPKAVWSYTILNPSGSGLDIQFDGTASQNAVNYNWDFGDGNTVSGTATPKHTYQTPALSYEVTLVVTNNCGDRDTLKETLEDISLIEQRLLAKIEVFPNPVKDILIIQSSMKELLRLKLYNSQGQIVKESQLTGEELILRMEDLPAGSYLLLISHDKSGMTRSQVILK